MSTVADVAEIEAIIGYIEAHPDEWDQNVWAERVWAMRETCGTTYCVAGHAVLRAGYQIMWEPRSPYASSAIAPDKRIENIEYAAKSLLRLNPYEAAALFSGSNTLDDLKYITKAIANGEIDEDWG